MPKQRIRRTGNHALVFQGQLLHSANNRRTPDCEHKYWHELAVYRVEECEQTGGPEPGSLLVKVTCLSTMKIEIPHEWAAWGSDLEQCLASYPPLLHVVGFPPGEKFAEADKRLSAGIQERWLELAGDAVARLDHAERIDKIWDDIWADKL